MKLPIFKNWEYWPSFMFYVPLLPYAFYLGFKYRSFGFFSAVNPGIEGSGNGLESKYRTLQSIPKQLRTKTIRIDPNFSPERLLQRIEKSGLSFPLIVKPDIGYRGLLVKKIENRTDLLTYFHQYGSIRLLIQELIEYPNECGIFYHKMPGNKRGRITSITLKKFLSVTGDGKSSLKTLIISDIRAKRYINLLKTIHGNRLMDVPEKNERVMLTIIGNHSKGTQFINGNHLISKELEHTFDVLQKQIKGWYYGRMDLKYSDFENLQKGKGFKVIELNGIISEPTHIYDASKGSYFKALASIKKHWKLLGVIGKMNKDSNKGKFTDFKFLINLYFRHKNYAKRIKRLQKAS